MLSSVEDIQLTFLCDLLCHSFTFQKFYLQFVITWKQKIPGSLEDTEYKNTFYEKQKIEFYKKIYAFCFYKMIVLYNGE